MQCYPARTMLQRLTNIAKANPATYPWLLLGCFYLASLLFFWPGIMSPDATSQYSMAISGVYTDHHPPMMSFVWRYLAQIYPGPAPMFILHVSLLYISAAIFIHIFKQSRFKWWYAFYPLLPNLVAYTALIVKDTGFTYTYLLSSAIMTYMMLNHTKKYKWPLLSTIILLLFYGTAVKFQAKYILVFFTIGVGYCLNDYKLNLKTVMSGILICFLILAAVTTTNKILVPAGKGSNSWQHVKIYDLSSISIALNKPLYPDYILQQEQFDFDRVKQIFEPREVDPLVFHSNPPIRGGSAEQLQTLWDYWFKTIIEHPILYLKARATLFKYDLITSPCERNNPVKFLSATSLAPILDIPGVGTTIDAGFTFFKVMLRFVWFVPLLFAYLIFALRNINISRAAAPLLLLCSSSCALMAVLFFCSMAGTARYVFLCACLVHAAHGLAYKLWQEARVTFFKNKGFRQLLPKSL